jgi:hypothetical protein
MLRSLSGTLVDPDFPNSAMKKLDLWTPDIDPATIPDQVLTSEWGRRRSARGKVHSGGRGRWIADRCPCGKMTRARAEKRNHKCIAPAGAKLKVKNVKKEEVKAT